MNSIVPQLSAIAEDLSKERVVQPVTTREFLSWFNAQRRGYWIVQEIRRQLEGLGLQTVPDFEFTYIDAPIEFRTIVTQSVPEPMPSALEAQTNITGSSILNPNVEISTFVIKDPTYRISKLAAANQQIVSVKPDTCKAECITILLSRDFSQISVMTNDREVKGIVSWKSIGSRLALSRNGSCARDFMELHREIRASASMFEAIPLIIAHEYVLVRGDDNRITGIITATDLSQQFRILSEPFLLLAEIENLVRAMIADRFTVAELNSARDPRDDGREVKSPADLSFGEYIRLLQNSDRWQKFGLAIDRTTFCGDLDFIRDIRNNIMHFDPEGIVEAELSRLRDFAGFLKQLQNIFASKA